MAGETDEPEDDWARPVLGVPIERNLRSLTGIPVAHSDPLNGYAAHTRGFNAFSIGVSVCGMRNAVDRRPNFGVDPGPRPITVQQIRSLIGTCVSLLAQYNLEPIPEQFFTHYEAETLHGVDQIPVGPGTWKWDITWLPHRPDMLKEDVGPWIREQVVRWKKRFPIDLPSNLAWPE